MLHGSIFPGRTQYISTISKTDQSVFELIYNRKRDEVLTVELWMFSKSLSIWFQMQT